VVQKCQHPLCVDRINLDTYNMWQYRTADQSETFTTIFWHNYVAKDSLWRTTSVLYKFSPTV